MRARSGQAAVELVLVLPVLLMLLLGVADVGRVMTASATLSRAVASGARRAIDSSLLDTAITSAVRATSGSIVPSTISIARAGDSVVVTASTSIQSITPLMHLLWANGTIVVSSSATARVVQ